METIFHIQITKIKSVFLMIVIVIFCQESMAMGNFFRNLAEALGLTNKSQQLSDGAVMGFFDYKQPSQYKLQKPEYHFSDPAVQSLVKAALAGDKETALKLVADGVDPNAQGTTEPGSNFGFSPLHYAIAAGSSQGIRLLVELGANPELKAKNMGMPLLFAIILNNVDILSLLLDLKPVDKLSPTTQQHLLFESARRDAPACLELLLQRGVPLDIKDSAGYNLFLRALDMQYFDLALWLLKRGSAIDFLAGGDLSPAYSVQFDLERMKEGSLKKQLLLEIKQLMQTKGAVFPAESPDQIRARQSQKK